jgi:hypothetical protein
VASVTDSRVLKLPLSNGPPAPGDLVLAAIASRGAVNADVTAPAGWSRLPSAQADAPDERLQVFFKIARAREPISYTFTAASAQTMSAGLIEIMGASPTAPIAAAAAQVNSTAARSVGAPSISPASANTLLVFLGATTRATGWKAPQGMKLEDLGANPDSPPRRPIAIATQRWRPPTATGQRTATIATAQPSLGALIGVNLAAPIGCPTVRILTHHYKPTPDGLIRARLKCVWAAPCVGAFEGVDMEEQFPVPRIAASDFSIPAGQTRTVPVALTPGGRRALRRHHTLHFDVFVWAFTASKQFVLAGGGAYKITDR